MWRRRYPYRRPRRRPDGCGEGCTRDACLVETGCCIGEALGDNCLLTSFVLLPQFLAAVREHGTGRNGMVAAIRVYQREISAHRPAVCRFEPSCSQYAVEALRAHGAVKGLWLAARRLLRCRPGGGRGADPIPLEAIGGLTVL
jgi:uncharacterized protein